LDKNVEKTPSQISSEVSVMADGLAAEPTAVAVSAPIDSKKSELEGSQDSTKSELEGRLAGEGLRKLNRRMTDMVEIRKKELAEGITEGHLYNSLTGVKLINDQFNFIWKISEDLLKTIRA
jgi:hypothetical protein